jgi:hypothetical protein
MNSEQHCYTLVLLAVPGNWERSLEERLHGALTVLRGGYGLRPLWVQKTKIFDFPAPCVAVRGAGGQGGGHPGAVTVAPLLSAGTRQAAITGDT